jgi:catechol 2,3-dioxygenase-like lactoylglutathione lyase family enzyme
MRIVVTSVFVEDQEKALSFYTEVLGFQKKTDIPLGERPPCRQTVQAGTCRGRHSVHEFRR